MSAHDRVRWDKIYRERLKQPYPAPDPLLLNYTPHIAGVNGGDEEIKKRALDVAAGFGQNGLWLAGQGYTTDIMEISRVALARARAEMARRNLRNVNLLQIDLDDIDLDEEQYDLICVFRYLKREVIPVIRAAIVPGGRIIYESFNINYLDIVPHFNTHFLLMPGELTELFKGWKVLHQSDESHISQLVAVKADGEIRQESDADLLDNW